MLAARLFVFLIAALALIACDEPAGGNTCKSTGAVTVDATDAGGFIPASVTIQPTQRVCWQNLGTLTHTITSQTVSDSTDITLPPDYTYTRGFGDVGTDFPYHCTLHANENGLIQVR